MITGKATLAATDKACSNHTKVHIANQRQLGALGLKVTSIGLGTGQFPPTNEPRVIKHCAEVVKAALRGGINLIDCSSNYSHGAAEAIVGCVVAELIEKESFNRSRLVLCSKGGYVKTLRPARNKDVIDYQHSLDPKILQQQLEESRRRLQLNTIDIYFLHNPEEYLLKNGRAGFETSILRAFDSLETAVVDGKIAAYGIASAEGFRLPGAGYHSLERFIKLAEQAAGSLHHFSAVQLPFSLSQPEALYNNNEMIKQEKVSLLQAASSYDLAVIGSASLNRMRLPPQALSRIAHLCPSLDKPAQAALCFAHSVPGIHASLFGTQCPEHVETALKVLAHPPMEFIPGDQP